MITPPSFKDNWNSPERNKLTMEEDRIDEAAKRVSRTRIREKITGICASCSRSMLYRTARGNDTIVRCTDLEGSPRMPTDIEECSRYQAMGQLNVSALAQMATLIDPDEKKEMAGFKVPIIGKE